MNEFMSSRSCRGKRIRNNAEPIDFAIVRWPVCLTLVFLLLGGCGGGGSNGAVAPPPPPAPPSPPNPPAAATLEMTPVAIKTFRFTWQDVRDATHYRVLENPDSNSGFTQIGDDIQSGVEMFDHVVPLYSRLSARYLLQSCNAGGCTDSTAIDVAGSLADAIGYVKASNTGAGDEFGGAVSVSGDGHTLAVGASWEDSGAIGVDGNQSDDSIDESGAVYVLVRVGDHWLQQAYLKASNSGFTDRFGAAVALSAWDGNTLAVGAIRESSAAGGIDGDQDDDSEIAAGAVYVFSRTGNTWSQQAYVKASNPDTFDRFGSNVSLSADGSTLVVAAAVESSGATGIGGNQADNSAIGAGAVYVFERNAGIWSQRAYIKASNTEAQDSFGAAVSLSGNGDTLAVGARWEDSSATGIDSIPFDNSAMDSGAVYVFSRANGIWSQEAYIKASNTGAGDEFGNALSLSADGNTLAVCALREDSIATGVDGDQENDISVDSGAAYVFRRTNGVWSQQAYIKATNTDLDDGFGVSVDLNADGSLLAVGALRESGAATGIDGDQTDNSAGAAGAVYLFRLDGSAWFREAYLKASNTEAGDLFGTTLSLSDDGNILAVGAVAEDSSVGGVDGDQGDNSAVRTGAVYLY